MTDQPVDSETGSITAANTSGTNSSQNRVPIIDLIQMPLPSSDIVYLLLESYISNIHWYQLVIHQPSFMAEFDEMVESNSIESHRLSFLMLSLVILAMGCTFVNPEITLDNHPGLDLRGLQKRMICTVEANFLKMFDVLTIECAQAGSLLSTYWGFHDNSPLRSEIILGGALKAAITLQLNDESAWGDIDSTQKEIRRRCWRSFCISETSQWNLSIPRNLDDTQVRYPTFHSTELLEDGSRQDVTLITYQRHKHSLYELMSEIIDMFYHQKSKSVPEIIQQAKLIQERLGNWKSELPPELKLISFKNDPPGTDIPEMLRVFRVQSLALQILYYNAQIILYRPFLTPRKKSSAHRFRSPGIPSVIGDTIVENHDLAFYQICRTQCWTAAMETPLDVLESLESDGNSRMSRQTLTLVDHNELASSSIPVGQDPIGTEPLVLDSEMCLHMEDLPGQSLDSFEDAVTTLQSAIDLGRMIHEERYGMQRLNKRIAKALSPGMTQSAYSTHRHPEVSRSF
ncbi:hypothetical protein E8E14_003382 [Neopestalotiopsis sp. 37M]|nr:hypothetical protein E8E14_003382 [Neopestalotiopsis sp. 37M]